MEKKPHLMAIVLFLTGLICIGLLFGLSYKTCDSSVNKYRKNHLQEQQQKSSNRVCKGGNCCEEERNCHHYSEIRKEIREVQGYREVIDLKRII